MRRLEKRPVDLPHLTTKVVLPVALANTLEALIRAGSTGITLDGLAMKRISQPTAKLEELINGGAIIHVIVRKVPNPYEGFFEDTPHYVLKGWIG